MFGLMRPLVAISSSLITAGVLILLLVWNPGVERADRSVTRLHFYCAAGMKEPVADIARDYEEAFGVRIEIDYGGSGTLLSKLKVAGEGDLFLAADESYILIGQEEGLIGESLAVANIRPVILVPKGNPRGIRGVDDLLSAEVRVSLANPEAASIGKMTQTMLQSFGIWEEVSEAVTARGVYKPTVNDVANDIKLGACDAGITWDATAVQYPELEIVQIEGADAFIAQITVGILESSQQPAEAMRFARYLTAKDQGLKRFEAEGYSTANVDSSDGLNGRAIEGDR